ncbi:MAG TPA: hypothetical protein VGK67_11785 [Myxococcales bacterium]|jgi:hypothetical protein
MRSALLAVFAAMGLGVAATQIEGAALETMAQGASRWAERARRVPAVLPGEVQHASMALDGGAIDRHHAGVRQLESIAVPGPVVAIAEREGELVLGTFDGGAWRVKAGGEPEKLPMDERINDLAFDAEGTLWAATAGGAWEIRNAEPPKRRAGGAFQAVALWRGRAWFASPRGLSVADEQGFLTRGRDQGFPADGPTALSACGKSLCVGALDGLWIWDGTRATRAGSDTGALPADFVTAVAFGPAGLWAGTFDAGLARLFPDSRRVTPADGLQDGRIQPHALVVGNDAVWAGTPAGLLELRGTSSAALLVDGLPTPELTALAPAREGGLWMGHQRGATRILVTLNPEVQL